MVFFFPYRAGNSALKWLSNEVLLVLTNTDIWGGELINFVPSRNSSYKSNSSFLEDVFFLDHIKSILDLRVCFFKLSNYTLLTLYALLIPDKNNLLIFQNDFF